MTDTERKRERDIECDARYVADDITENCDRFVEAFKELFESVRDMLDNGWPSPPGFRDWATVLACLERMQDSEELAETRERWEAQVSTWAMAKAREWHPE